MSSTVSIQESHIRPLESIASRRDADTLPETGNSYTSLASEVTPTHLQLGNTIYTIIKELAGGSEPDMTQSFMAENDRMQYAIKQKHFRRSDALTQIPKLAQLTQQLRDLGIAEEELFVKQDGEFTNAYIVRPWIAGKNLNEAIITSPASLDETLRMAHQIGSKLEIAHSKDIVHRDVKLSNILLADDGTYHLIDFGIAKDMHGETTFSYAGTPGFKAPETYNAKASAASDIYGLAQAMIQYLGGDAPSQVVGEDDERYKRTHERIDKLRLPPHVSIALKDATYAEVARRTKTIDIFLTNLTTQETPLTTPSIPDTNPRALQLAREIDEQLKKYDLPQGLAEDRAKLLTTFDHEYQETLSSRNPIDNDFEKKLITALDAFGYKRIRMASRGWTNLHIRYRKDSTSVDVAVIHNESSALKIDLAGVVDDKMPHISYFMLKDDYTLKKNYAFKRVTIGKNSDRVNTIWIEHVDNGNAQQRIVGHILFNRDALDTALSPATGFTYEKYQPAKRTKENFLRINPLNEEEPHKIKSWLLRALEYIFPGDKQSNSRNAQ